MALLFDKSAMEATQDSPTAAYAPKLMPGTRAKVINDIMAWIAHQGQSSKTPAPQTSILWFSGPAGAGKTCIQREVAKRSQERGMLVISYFFSTRVPNLDNSIPFVFTITQQLIEKVPA